MRLVSTALLLVSVLPALHAQPAFEVASIRSSAKRANGLYGNYKWSGGPGTNDPGRIVIENFDIRALILKAYDIPLYAFSGPEWLFDIRFDVTATMPPETTKEQFLLMQQNLLATRLGLVVHREKKELPLYELVVAKGGSKLKESVPHDQQEPDRALLENMKKDADGFPVLPPGGTMYAMMGNHATQRGSAETMEHLASTLSGQMQAPVNDRTGLTGKYDFTMKWIPGNLRPDDDPSYSLESALPAQLGLTLRKYRGPMDVLVVDHVEKTATEN